MFVKKFLLALISIGAFCDAANILVWIPTPAFSHQVAFRELWRELASRGHQVTLVNTEPKSDPAIPNLREISYGESYDIWNVKHKFSEKAQEGLGFWNIWHYFLYLLSDISEYQLSQPEIQELINGKDEFHFDLVIVEVFYPELLAFGKIYNAPTMLVATLGSTIQMYQYLGNPVHPVLNSDINVPYSGTLSFKERLISTWFHWYQSYFEYFTFLPKKQRILDRYIGNVTEVSIRDLIGDIDMMLVNIHPILKGPRALGPNTIEVGGGNHLKPLKPLPQDLKEFLGSSTEGFVYFSLGGNVRSKELGSETITNILDAFRELPYKVLWKFETDSIPELPMNVKMIKWAPQQDILRHENIKLFVTQGGIQSIEEAIFTHVPMVVMPFYGDQLKNARILEDKHIGKFVNHKPVLKKEDLKNAILEVINDESYKNSITKMAELILDEPMTGLEKSIWWIEYMIRNKGAKHLRNPASDIPYYQFYLIDVVAFTVLVAISTILFIKIAIKQLRRCFVNISNRRVKKRRKMD